MINVTARQVGNSVAISIPKQFHVEPGAEYVAYKSKNGGLTFAPKMENPFLSDIPFEKDGEDQWQALAEEGIEKSV